MRLGVIFAACAIALMAVLPAWSASPCDASLRNGTVCQTKEAARLLRARNVSGAIVVQDVETGAIITVGSSVGTGEAGSSLTAASTILPLSTAKLFLAASWLSHADEFSVEDRRLRAAIVYSADEDGRLLALDLRKTVGTSVVLEDLTQYGFVHCAAAEPQRAVPAALMPRACTTLDDKTDDPTWASAFSLGEANFSVSLIQLSSFMQAIGNNGVRLSPTMSGFDNVPAGFRREEQMSAAIMTLPVTRKLQGMLREVVERGTARGMNGRVRGGWTLGGKTGTGPAGADPADGIFVGLLFDPQGKARYSVAIYVERGGKGGGAAAEIACDLFNFLLGL